MRSAAAFGLALMLLSATASAEDALPELGPAPAFSLMSQNRKPVSLMGLRGKVVAVTFIYTACPDICPLLTQKIVEVAQALGGDFGSKVAFVVITFDPERDTSEILKNYAEAFGATGVGWNFLTGPPAVVRDLTSRYGVVAVKNADGFIDHNLVTSIVDPRGMLRVQYIGMRFDPDAFRHDLLSLLGRP